MDDSELVNLARRGDMQAFGDLIDRHRHAAFRAALSALRSSADADEVAQEAFVAAYRKLDMFRGDASFKTWLLAIVWRKAVDRRTRGGWVKRLVSIDGFPTAFGGSSTASGTRSSRAAEASPAIEFKATGRSPEEALLDIDMREQLRRLIRDLPATLRDTLVLASSGEYRYEEIGGMLGIPVGTVKWRVSEARRVLKGKLGELGYGHD